MKHYFLLLLFLLPAFARNEIYAQKQGQAAIDSMLEHLPQAKEDTGKVKILNSLSAMYHIIKPGEGLRYGQLGLELATKLKWQKGIAAAKICIGNNYYSQSDYSKALEDFLQALNLYDSIGDKPGISIANSNLGNIYFLQSRYPKALEYYLRSLKAAEEMDDKNGIAKITGSIGGIYRNLGDFPKALDYYFKALKLDEQAGDKYLTALMNGSVGIVYAMQNDPRALEYFFKQLKIDEEIGDNIEIANVSGNIGNVYTDQGKYLLAMEYLQKALKMQKENGDKKDEASALCNIGEIYLAIVKDTTKANTDLLKASRPDGKYGVSEAIPAARAERLRRAIDYLQRGVALSRELNAMDVLLDGYDNLTAAYKLSGDYRMALAASGAYHALRDSVFSKDNDKKIVQQGMQFEFEKVRMSDSLKHQEDDNLNKMRLQRQKSFTYIGFSGILLLAGFSFFIFKERRKSERLLLNILPSEVAAELKRNGSSEARHFDEVTVLFTDFVSFTKTSMSLSPKELVHELDVCFKAFDAIMEQYKVEKIKTVGDAYLAVCGLPRPTPGHAVNMVAAAMEIRSFMARRNDELGDKTFPVRIGIHTGSVVAGIVGVKKFAYDIWGDTVNTAARMEQNSEPGKINISQTTYDLVNDKINCTYRGEIDAKGKGTLKMYFVE